MKKSAIIIILFLTFACGVSNPVNDFFGIQMNPQEEESFKIVSYNEFEGAQYTSSPSMNNEINAWAEIGVEEITFKIVNNSTRLISFDYFSDNYVLITNQDNFNMDKGNQIDYFTNSQIEPNSSAEISLKIPSDFAQDFIKRGGAILKKDIMGDFSKNWSQNSILKENLKYIVIKLGDVVLLLKKVPEQL